MLPPDRLFQACALVGAVQPPATPSEPDRTLVIALGVALIGGLVVLMLVLSLRLIRRVADGTPIVAAERRKKRPMRGAGRDPWREAGRRMVVPPPEVGRKDPPEGTDEEDERGPDDRGGGPKK